MPRIRQKHERVVLLQIIIRKQRLVLRGVEGDRGGAASVLECLDGGGDRFVSELFRGGVDEDARGAGARASPEREERVRRVVVNMLEEIICEKINVR